MDQLQHQEHRPADVLFGRRAPGGERRVRGVFVRPVQPDGPRTSPTAWPGTGPSRATSGLP